jgi:hypothetical protein
MVEFVPFAPNVATDVPDAPAPTVTVYVVPAVMLVVPVSNPPAPPPPPVFKPPPAPPPATTRYSIEVAPAGAVHVLDEKNTITLAASKLVGVVGANVPEDVNE